MECGLALRDGDKGGSEAKKRGGGEKRRGKKLRKKQIHQLYSSPFSMIPLSNHGYKGNKKHGH